jgi:hypothetical protein
MAKIISLGISARKDSILELIFKGNGSNLEALLQNPNFSTPLWLIVWDQAIMNAVANSQTAMDRCYQLPDRIECCYQLQHCYECCC